MFFVIRVFKNRSFLASERSSFGTVLVSEINTMERSVDAMNPESHLKHQHALLRAVSRFEFHSRIKYRKAWSLDILHPS